MICGVIMNLLEQCIKNYKNKGLIEHIAVRVGDRNGVLCEYYDGADENTLFDMASVTKIAVTTMLAFVLLENGELSLGESMRWFYRGCESPITIKHLLTHTCGFGHKPLNLEGNTYQNIDEYILSIPHDIKIGTDVLYSCPGFVLLGKIVERKLGMSLADGFKKYVAEPLGMSYSGYCPKSDNIVNANKTEQLRGVVNDYNCQFLGGVAGNAGLFSNITDMTKFVKMLLNYGAPILRSPLTFKNAITNHTKGMSASRGLGFVIVDDRYKQTGRLFENGTFGHGGHTGQSVFCDINSGLYAIVLSDATLHSDNYEQVKKFREDIHNAIADDLKRKLETVKSI